jgi:3-deoxy-manno-octulosonate cytidylyltransferase (CMP-KDO synthetase)
LFVHPRSEHGPSITTTRNRVTAVIPVRFSSTRFPGKALADLAGRPMVEHVYRAACAARSVGCVIVATDDERIRDAVAAFGGEVRMTAASHASGTDRVAEVAASLDCDIVVNVQGDEPLLDPLMIDEAVAALVDDPSLPASTLRRRLDDRAALDDPNVCKVVVTQEGDALYFSRAPIPFARGPQTRLPGGPERLIPAYWKHIGLYAYRRAFLLELARLQPTPLERSEALEQLRVLEHGYRLRVVETAHDSIGVDTPQDLERVRRRLNAAQPARQTV